MANKKINELPRLSVITETQLIPVGNENTGELYAATVALLLSFAIRNETISFAGVSELTLQWDILRKAKYGDSGKFYVEIVGDDGIARNVTVEIIPNSLSNTTSYHFDFGGISTGRITIS